MISISQDIRDIYLPHGWFLFLVVHGQWGFPVAHCLTGSDLSAHLFHFGLHVSVLPEGHLGWERSSLAQTCPRTSSILVCMCQSCLRGTWAGSHLHWLRPVRAPLPFWFACVSPA